METTAQLKARAKRLMDNYGTTPEEWDVVHEFQNRVCWACKRPQKSGKRLATDHDHTSGLFRSLLCSTCNRLLGRIERAYPKGTDIKIVLGRLLEVLSDPPAIRALGKKVFGYAGRTGTKKQRNYLRKIKKMKKMSATYAVSVTTQREAK